MSSPKILHELDSYYVDNVPEALGILETAGYTIAEGAYSNRDYYMEYPYLLIHEGHIEFCHNRHLNRADLYGINKKLELIDGHFMPPIGLGEVLSKTIDIEGQPIELPENLYDKVTYVPPHAKGNAGHKDCDQGVIVGVVFPTDKYAAAIRVLYCKGRNVQQTPPELLVWG